MRSPVRRLMPLARTFVVLLASVSAAFAGNMGFSEELETISPMQEDFAARFVEVMNTSDMERYFAEILHPASKAALEEHPSFMEQVLSNISRRSLPGEYYVSIKELEPDSPLPFEPTLMYPVRPTHSYMISYDEPDGSGVSILLQAREEDGAIYEVFPVPSPE